MPDVWTELPFDNFAKDATAQKPLDFHGRWALLIESLQDTEVLMIRAEGGQWKPGNSILDACGPDGYANYGAPEAQLVLTDVWYCALIGKIGGSSADHIVVAADKKSEPIKVDQAFAIGSFCSLPVPEGTGGPLYIGFNGLQRPISILSLPIKIFGRKRTKTEQPDPADAAAGGV